MLTLWLWKRPLSSRTHKRSFPWTDFICLLLLAFHAGRKYGQIFIWVETEAKSNFWYSQCDTKSNTVYCGNVKWLMSSYVGTFGSHAGSTVGKVVGLSGSWVLLEVSHWKKWGHWRKWGPTSCSLSLISDSRCNLTRDLEFLSPKFFCHALSTVMYL